jgi:hypothetical protein
MAEIRFDSLEIPGKYDNRFESLETISQDASLYLIKPCFILSAQLDTLGVTGSSPVAPIRRPGQTTLVFFRQMPE